MLVEDPFLDETHLFPSNPKLILNTKDMPQPNQGSLTSTPPSTSLDLSAKFEADPDFWKLQSLKAATEALPRLSDANLDDANLLLVFLCFLADHEKISVDFLFRGATPRKRWSEHGGIEEMDANRAGLSQELARLLSDISRLSNAFHELELLSVVSKHSDQTYTVDEVVVGHIRASLSPELLSIWRGQALIVAYRSIPWKYIEPS